MTVTVLLEGIDLHKSFGPTQALIGATVRIRAGEVVAVMGPSGSGKSTLLHCLAGIVRADSGQVRYAGRDLTTMSDAERSALRRRDFGFVFQFGQLVPELTCLENVALPLRLNGVRRREAEQRAQGWLERLGVAEVAGKRPGEVSGGQGQRVAVARALIHQPAGGLRGRADRGAGFAHRRAGDAVAHRGRGRDRRRGGAGHARAAGGRVRQPGDRRPGWPDPGSGAGPHEAPVARGAAAGRQAGDRRRPGRLGTDRADHDRSGVGGGVAAGGRLPAHGADRPGRARGARYPAWPGPEAVLEPAEDTLLATYWELEFRDERIWGVVLQPEGPAAPVPPGLTALPGPGELVVSPALAELLASPDGPLLAPRLDYPIVGQIGDEGLRGPYELMFYLGSDQLDPESTSRIDHFGVPSGSGEGLPVLLILLGVVGLVALLLPVATFITVASRFGGEQTDRRLAAIRLVGADQGMVRRIAAGEVLLGTVAGMLMGGLLFLVGRALVESVPAIDVFTADVRPPRAGGVDRGRHPGAHAHGHPVRAAAPGGRAARGDLPRRWRPAPAVVAASAHPGRPGAAGTAAGAIGAHRSSLGDLSDRGWGAAAPGRGRSRCCRG